MAKEPRRPRDGRSPILRHHLEDVRDSRNRVNERENRSHRQHRQQQYLHLARRHLALVIEGQVGDPQWDGARLEQLEANADGSVLTLVVEIPELPEESGSSSEFDGRSSGPDGEGVAALEGMLRAELAQHVPRRRTPRLMVLLKYGFS